MKLQNLKPQKGFTLVELMVTIIVLAIVSGGLTLLFSSIQYVQASASYRRSATLAAQRQIESLRTSNYAALAAGSSIDFSSNLPAELPKPRTATASITEPANGVKRVDITITYKDRGASKQVKVSSMIGEIGITK